MDKYPGEINHVIKHKYKDSNKVVGALRSPTLLVDMNNKVIGFDVLKELYEADVGRYYYQTT